MCVCVCIERYFKSIPYIINPVINRISGTYSCHAFCPDRTHTIEVIQRMYNTWEILAKFLYCCVYLSMPILPYSRKYWRELNLVVEPKIAIARILSDLNLAVRYGIAIRIYASRKFLWILIWRL